MKKIASVLLLFSLSFQAYSQKISGIYTGELQLPQTHRIDPSTGIGIPVYRQATLRFKRNGQFSLAYLSNMPCPAQLNSRLCTGTYEVRSDTLYLQSKYTANDFYTLDYQEDTSHRQDSMLLVIDADSYTSSGCLLKGHQVSLKTDRGRRIEVKVQDSVVISKQTKSIGISMDCPTDMDWLIQLNPENQADKLDLRLLCRLKGENVHIDGVRFYIREDALELLDGSYFLPIRDNVFLKGSH